MMNFTQIRMENITPIIFHLIEELISRQHSYGSFQTFVGAFLALPITLSFFVCAVLAVVTVMVMFMLKLLFGLRGAWLSAAAAFVVLLIPATAMSRFFVSFLNRLIYERALLAPLDAAGDVHQSLAGFKASGLSKMIKAGLPAPAGFIITGRVFDLWIRKAGIDGEIRIASGETGAEEKIRSILLREKIPRGTERRIKAWMRKLRAERVILRSSFPGEDSGKGSMAGVYRSVIADPSGEGWKDALKEVWASYYSAAACAERKRHGISASGDYLPVIVQEYMEYDTSLTATSVNFLNGCTEEMLFDFRKASGETGVVVLNTLTGTEIVTAGENEQLSHRAIKQFADAMLKLEAIYGCHVQMEAGLKDGLVYIHQVRPLTGFQSCDTFINSYVVDIIDDALTPLSRGLFCLPDSLENLIRNKFAQFGLNFAGAIVREINGRFYLHYNPVRSFFNPHQFRRAAMVPGAVAASLKNFSSALRPGRWRREVERAAMLLGDVRKSDIRAVRDGALLPLFKTQFEIFHAADFLIKTTRGLLAASLPEKDEAMPLLERIATPAGVAPYYEMLDELGKLDGESEKSVREFIGKYGHWGAPEAEVAAKRMGDDPLPWIERAGTMREGSAGRAGRRDAIQRIEQLLNDAWRGSLFNPVKYIFRLLAGKAGEMFLIREMARDLLNRFLFEIKKKILESGIGESGFYMTPDELANGVVDAEAVKKKMGEHAAVKSMRSGPIVHLPEISGDEKNYDGKFRGMGLGRGVAAGPVLVEPHEGEAVSGERYVLVVRSPAAIHGVLLAGACALVTERGGPLSHLVILARESGLPVLVGAEGVCDALRTGDAVRIDAEKGWLEIVS